jgi:hypothetical protein
VIFSVPIARRFCLAIATLVLSDSHLNSQPTLKTTHVIWVMTDGLRTQEVFAGADPALMTPENHVTYISGVKPLFLRDTPAAARQALMPFFWSMIAGQGQVYGNRALGSEAEVTNGFNLSYPGYNETLTGLPDPRIDSNDFEYNPNVTVLEWLDHKPAFRGKVAAFAAWDRFGYILNHKRATFPISYGYEPFTGLPGNPRIQLLNDLKAEAPRDWREEPFDYLTFHTALEYLKQRKPRLLYLSLGETDEWAHDGKYGEYLRAAHRADQYLRILWETVQSVPEYRGTTTLVFTTDHGRGAGEVWRTHGRGTPDSRYIWMAFLGPDTAALGERKQIYLVKQSQLAVTVAAFLGENYLADKPNAGAPIVDVLERPGPRRR